MSFAAPRIKGAIEEEEVCLEWKELLGPILHVSIIWVFRSFLVGKPVGYPHFRKPPYSRIRLAGISA